METINCADLSRDLLRSEIFGCELDHMEGPAYRIAD